MLSQCDFSDRGPTREQWQSLNATTLIVGAALLTAAPFTIQWSHEKDVALLLTVLMPE
jgi:hypothetical protein